MARTTADRKIDTRRKIVKAAARAFRSDGASVGIADIMGELGLTNGGFYRHFSSKDDLFVEAACLALDEVGERLVLAAERAQPGLRRKAIITTYLSPEHVANPDSWCVIAAIAGDLGRAPWTIRKRLDAAMFLYIQRLMPYMTGTTPQEQQRDVIVLISAMAGAIMMVRTLGDKQMRESVLALTRDYYLTTFG